MTGEKSKTASSTQTFTEYLRSTRRRCTPERLMILSCAEGCGRHFTAEELSRSLEESGHHVATGTVYSTLELLVECGLAVRHRFAEQGNRYELTPSAGHLHLVCTHCGRIKDVRDATLAGLLKARRYTAFTPTGFALTVYGVCSACSRREKKEKSNSKPTIKPAQ
ncbi:MAG: transcriptional repressor [Bacteroidales bacterium]|nr:transcriptional repressor [Bacteroidales bacterium]